MNAFDAWYSRAYEAGLERELQSVDRLGDILGDAQQQFEAIIERERDLERERAARFAQTFLFGVVSPAAAPSWTRLTFTVGELNALVERLRSGVFE